MHADTQVLLARRAETLQELERLRTALEHTEVDISEDEADPDFVEREKLVALMSAVEVHLAEIDAALEQAQSGAYGICERCGQPIDPERLKIMPEATMCVRCKALTEKQRGSGMPRRQELFDET
jgi:RNA polymerase-binding transcription factor DksA